MTPPRSVLLTCEHAGHELPTPWEAALAVPPRVLMSHRGWDRGALPIAKHFAAALRAPLFYSTVSRLAVDLNRSAGRPGHLSPYSLRLPPVDQAELIAAHYTPFRQQVRDWMKREIAGGRQVVHVSVHTFTPVRRGEVRRADVGLLYDPRRTSERTFAAAWRRHLRGANAELVVRLNYPYFGKSDGHTTSLRKLFSTETYLGLELEINQRWPRPPTPRFATLQKTLTNTFIQSLNSGR